jgi:hypothetical protein
MTSIIPAPSLLAGSALVGLLGACAAPPPPPLLSLDGRDCAAQPDFVAARPLRLDPDKVENINLDAAPACFVAPDGSKSSYAAFALPDQPTEFLVSITSWQRGRGMLSPHILVYDPIGRLVREIPRDSFQFHNQNMSLYAGLRIHPGEHYVVVASDPKTIGQQNSEILDAIHTNTSTGTSATAHGGTVVSSFSYHYGTETQNVVSYSYNGLVSATAQPIAKVP